HFLSLVRRGRSLVRTYGVRLLHSNSGAPTQWLVPVARSERIPLVSHLHVPYGRRDRFVMGLHQATLAVGVTHGCIEGVLADGMPASRTKTIYNAVDLSVWGAGDETGLRARLGIEPDDIVLTRVGSLIHRKGVDLILRAFATLKRERRQCHLLIVGEGPDRPRLEALRDELGLQGSAHFLGLVPSAGAVLRDATDIAVSPARVEGFGLTVIEAGAAGLPVVATNTAGMTEIITSGESGLIIPVEDITSLLNGMRTLVDDPALRRRFGSALRQTVERRFLVSRYVSDFEHTYQDLLRLPHDALGWTGPRTPLGPYARFAWDVLRGKLTGNAYNSS
ncbi:MAG TPA: glycosyltransferase family 4 protein, partial [Gemmatimonadaceae bacterium]|nr:glycosyltransferase family 4 protein [Gemmatimonadaceae bacterium]